MDTMWWIGIAGIVIGLVLFIAEGLVPGFFLAIPATMFLILGFIALLAPNYFGWPLLIIMPIILGLATYATLKIYNVIAPPSAPETSSGGALIGQSGRVKRAVEPENLKGKVRVNNQMWSATSDKEITEGAKVKIIGMEGVHLIVEEVKE